MYINLTTYSDISEAVTSTHSQTLANQQENNVTEATVMSVPSSSFVVTPLTSNNQKRKMDFQNDHDYLCFINNNKTGKKRRTEQENLYSIYEETTSCLKNIDDTVAKGLSNLNDTIKNGFQELIEVLKKK